MALPALLGGFSCVFFLMTVSGLRVFEWVFVGIFKAENGCFYALFLIAENGQFLTWGDTWGDTWCDIWCDIEKRNVQLGVTFGVTVLTWKAWF